MALGKLYRQGSELKIRGSTDRPKLLIVEQFGFNHYFNDEIFQWIDTLAYYGLNGMRVFGFWPFGRGHEQEPYVRTTGSQFDLHRFNEPYFDYLKRWVTYAADHGIYVQYELFDSCGFWQASFAPFNPFYQLVKGDHLAFSDLLNNNLHNIQKAYIRKVLEALPLEQNNVIVGIMNEFKGSRNWHQEMSRYVKSLAPDVLVSGSEEDSSSADDPNVDIWAVHTGTYDFSTGKPHVPGDINKLRQKTGAEKILAYSTDGFGTSGRFRETPDDMRRLTQDVNRANLQIFSFLDQKAYKPEDWNNPSGSSWPGSVSLLNTAVYDVLDDEFQPTPPSFQTPLPDGFFDIFQVFRLPSTLKQTFTEHGGKAIKATYDHGFFCFGQYKKGYPQQPLKAYFSILIDNNDFDDRNILILDVYDHDSDRVIGKQLITRKDFPERGKYCLFEFDFTPPSASANMEFRIYYMGHAYIRADKIAIVDPTKVIISTPSDIP